VTKNERERIHKAFHRTRGVRARGTDEAARRGDEKIERQGEGGER